MFQIAFDLEIRRLNYEKLFSLSLMFRVDRNANFESNHSPLFAYVR